MNYGELKKKIKDLEESYYNRNKSADRFLTVKLVKEIPKHDKVVVLEDPKGESIKFALVVTEGYLGPILRCTETEDDSRNGKRYFQINKEDLENKHLKTMLITGLYGRHFSILPKLSINTERQISFLNLYINKRISASKSKKEKAEKGKYYKKYWRSVFTSLLRGGMSDPILDNDKIILKYISVEDLIDYYSSILNNKRLYEKVELENRIKVIQTLPKEDKFLKFEIINKK